MLRIAASRPASVTAAAASPGAGSVATSRTSEPSAARTNPHRSKKPATSGSALDPEPLDRRTRHDRLDERAPDALQPAVLDARKVLSARALDRRPRSTPMQPDELAIFAPADEGSRRLGGSGRSRVRLRARNEGLHLGVVGAATEIDESHSVRSISPAANLRG